MLSIKSETNKQWRNWSGSVVCTPTQILYPKSIEEVVTIVRRTKHAGKYLRVVGSGHSFPPVVHTDQILVSLDLLEGVVSVDKQNHHVTVYAGTKLHKLGPALEELGYAQINLGDINAQSIAGALSTGTHGTGIQFGILSTQAVAFTIVTADGTLLECSETKNADVFKAAQLSLGLLGIVVKITLRVVPRYRLHERTYRMDFDECLSQVEQLRNEYRNFEFFWFPYSDSVQIKTFNETEQEVSKHSTWRSMKTMVLENWVFALLSYLCRLFPSLSKSICKLSASGIPTNDAVGESYTIYATPRLVRFNEMEYFIPIEHFEAVMREIKETIEREQFAVNFPIECRFVKADDIWLSPAYERDSAVIAVHMFKGMPYESYFKAIEAIFWKYEGRPHWGKMHTITKEKAAAMWPKWKEFNKLRALFDPYDTFLNPYFAKLFTINYDKDQMDGPVYTTEQIVESVRTIGLDQ